MNMSFKEKSTWLSLIATLLVFGDYALTVLRLAGLNLSADQKIDVAMQNLSTAILYIIIIEIIFQSLISAASRNSLELKGDERDKLIMLSANNSGYWVLSVGVVITLGQLLLPHATGMESSIQSYISLPLFEVHLLLFSFIFAEIVRFSHQIILYRQAAI